MPRPSRERHAAARRRPALPCGVRVRVPGPGGVERQLMTKLVDAGLEGIGVEAYAAVRRGTIVHLESDLSPQELPLTLYARARVVHSTRNRNGPYHIGLRFEEVAYAKTA